MMNEDVLYELRKAMRALKRLETRIQSEQRADRRAAAKAKERGEMEQLAAKARERAAEEPEAFRTGGISL